MEMQHIEAQNIKDSRILARNLARELSEEELDIVSGGDCPNSTCSGSDNNSCDLDNCHLR